MAARARTQEFIIQWHLTHRCNLRCRHCYQESSSGAEMPVAGIVGVIREIAAMLQDWQETYGLKFSPSFNVTGGEPFLRGDFFIILEEIQRAGFATYVLSNGTLITPERGRTLAALGVKEVQISLEGPPAVHDTIRGPGSFAAALQGIGCLKEAGVPVSLNVTLSRMNAPYFMDLVELAAQLQVTDLGFSRLVPTGQGLALLDQMLSTREVEDLYREIFALRIPGLEIGTGDPMAAQMFTPPPGPETAGIPFGGCAAGVAGLTLLPDGTVLPCRRLPLPLGRAGRDSLRELWAVSPILQALREQERYQGKCAACPRWSACRGCRAIAYAWSRSQGTPDFLAADPQCFIEEVSREQ
jgi:radical SAM protein with 4Fe4S-binding SPASM domain